MEYVNYKKIHRHNTRDIKLTIVEWKGGGITLDKMGRVARGVWSGGAMLLTDATAKRVMKTLAAIFASRRKR